MFKNQNMLRFRLHFHPDYAKTRTPNFRQGSAATYWRYGGKYYMNFVGNLHGFPAVKEFWKSVKNWQSYRHEFGVLLFWNTVYMIQPRFDCDFLVRSTQLGRYFLQGIDASKVLMQSNCGCDEKVIVYSCHCATTLMYSTGKFFGRLPILSGQRNRY